MGPVSAEIAIDEPREVVFEFISDLRNRPAFTDHFISDYRLLRSEATGVGAGARFRLYAPPQAIWMDSTILELEPPHRLSERGQGGRWNRIPAAIEWELTIGTGSLTVVRVTHWTEPENPFDRAKEVLGGASIWYQRDWETAMRRLRDLLEGEPGTSAERAGGAVAAPVAE
jgi:uncharacterized protein YndB with AHSA1/START domain